MRSGVVNPFRLVSLYGHNWIFICIWHLKPLRPLMDENKKYTRKLTLDCPTMVYNITSKLSMTKWMINNRVLFTHFVNKYIWKCKCTFLYTCGFWRIKIFNIFLNPEHVLTEPFAFFLKYYAVFSYGLNK